MELYFDNIHPVSSTMRMVENSITFSINEMEILSLNGNGDIYVKGILVENDKDVVQGLRDWVNKTKEII